MSIRTIIVDDEPLARDFLRSLLSEDANIEVVAECNDGEAAIAAILELAPDLVFLDVQMPGRGGIEVLQAIGADKMPCVVFTTAFDNYAQQAFDFNAIDYLLKPFSKKRFTGALDKAKGNILQSAESGMREQLLALLQNYSPGSHAGSESDLNSRKIAVKNGKRVTLTAIEDIDWIEAADDYVILHAGSDAHLHSETMRNLESSLDPKLFLRIHRSAIVNLERIKCIESDSAGEYSAVLTTGAKVKVSRSRKKALDSAFGDHL